MQKVQKVITEKGPSAPGLSYPRGTMCMCQQTLRRHCLPDKVLKLPEGHDVHVPADTPPQPLRYWPARHDEATHEEQTALKTSYGYHANICAQQGSNFRLHVLENTSKSRDPIVKWHQRPSLKLKR